MVNTENLDRIKNAVKISQNNVTKMQATVKKRGEDMKKLDDFLKDNANGYNPLTVLILLSKELKEKFQAKDQNTLAKLMESQPDLKKFADAVDNRVKLLDKAQSLGIVTKESQDALNKSVAEFFTSKELKLNMDHVDASKLAKDDKENMLVINQTAEKYKQEAIDALKVGLKAAEIVGGPEIKIAAEVVEHAV